MSHSSSRCSDGRFIDYTKVAPENVLQELNRYEADERRVTVSTTQVRASGAQLEEIRHLLGNGTFRVAIDSSFPLGDARRAHERAAEGHIRGKIVLTVGEPV